MDHPLVVAARALAPTLAAHTDAHVRDRQLAAPVVEALHAGGFLRALLPAALDGAAVAPATYVDVLAALAEGDAATAWVVMTASTSTLLAAYLEPATARAIWAGPTTPLLAGVFAPGGQAVIEIKDEAPPPPPPPTNRPRVKRPGKVAPTAPPASPRPSWLL